MEAGSIWVRLGLDSAKFGAGIKESQKDLIKWRDETNANTRETMKWGKAIAATIAPVVAIGAASFHASQYYGGMAQELKKVAYETGKTTDSVQRLTQAQRGLYNTPVYSKEELDNLDNAKKGWDLLIEAATVYGGKGLSAIVNIQERLNKFNPVLAVLKKYMGEVGEETYDNTEKLKKFSEGIEKAAKKAQDFADKVKNAKKQIQDLSESIIDSGLSIEGERYTQADLGKEYSALEKELRLAELQADPNTSGGVIYANRVKEIKARMERIAYEMRLSQRSVTKSQNSIASAGQTYRDININIVSPTGTPAEIAEAALRGLREFWKIMSLEGMT